ncbi:MAG: hypothetical protein ACREEU_01845, partial [Acetobacteraceae bacterium]
GRTLAGLRTPVLALVLLPMLAPGPAPAAPTTAAPTAEVGAGGASVPLPPAAPAAGPRISGFRGARFGMTEAAVRAAIEHDLHLPASAIHAGNNAVERAAILSVKVADLAPGAGSAIVSYMFGYRSHELIEVNIVWSKPSDPSLTPERLAVIGARLQAYFATEKFPPAQTAMNVGLADGILLFRTVDPAGAAIALILSGPVHHDAKSGQRVLTPETLSLAYAADAAHPDVFRLEKGSF